MKDSISTSFSTFVKTLVLRDQRDESDVGGSSFRDALPPPSAQVRSRGSRGGGSRFDGLTGSC